MSIKNKTLPLDGCVNLVNSLVEDFVKTADTGAEFPSKKDYKVISRDEPALVKRAARMAAMKSLQITPLTKLAFDTRRVDQKTERVPRANLQHWNRSQQFLDDEVKEKIKSFSKLLPSLEQIKSKYGHHPEYFQSYAKTLLDSVKRIARVGESEMDIFRPQVDYLEQLLFTRYRLSLDEITKSSKSKIYDKLMKKDEDLVKRDAYLKMTGDSQEENTKNSSTNFAKDGNSLNDTTQDSIISAIFGNQDLRRDGEKKVERTITITIKDEVID